MPSNQIPTLLIFVPCIHACLLHMPTSLFILFSISLFVMLCRLLLCFAALQWLSHVANQQIQSHSWTTAERNHITSREVMISYGLYSMCLQSKAIHAFTPNGTQSILKFIRLLNKLERLQRHHALVADILLLATNTS